LVKLRDWKAIKKLQGKPLYLRVQLTGADKDRYDGLIAKVTSEGLFLRTHQDFLATNVAYGPQA
jgi:hypothetical protein